MISLESGDRDRGGLCIFGICGHYQDNDKIVVLVEENMLSDKLTIELLSVDFKGDDMTGGDGVRHEQTVDGIRIVPGDFRRPSEGDWGFGDQ